MKHPRIYKGRRLESIERAQDRGYISLTMPYRVFSPHRDSRETEAGYLDKTIADMEQPGRRANYCLVEVHNGVEVWRHRRELDIDPHTGVSKSIRYFNQ